MSKPIPGSYIDTQGMGGPMSPEDAKKAKKRVYKPSSVTPRRMFTPTDVKELKILINEVLDEREYKKRIKGAYDNVKPYHDYKLIEEKFYDYNKNLTLKDQYKYNQKDKLEEWNLIDSNGKLINNFEGVAKKLYQYNKQGNITDIELFDEDDVVVRKILYKYGKDGRLIESVIFFVKFMFGKVHEIPLEKSSFHYESW